MPRSCKRAWLMANVVAAALIAFSIDTAVFASDIWHTSPATCARRHTFRSSPPRRLGFVPIHLFALSLTVHRWMSTSPSRRTSNTWECGELQCQHPGLLWRSLGSAPRSGS